jgi:hypothetical protein
MARRLLSTVALLGLALGLAVAGCSGSDRPMRPGGGSNGGNDQPDAGEGVDSGGGGQVTGTICPIADLRFPTDCRPGNLEGVRVAVRGTTISATTGAAGTFSLDLTGVAGDSPVLVVAEDSDLYHPSLLRIALDSDGSASFDAPVVTEANYAALVAALDVSEPDDHGALALYLYADDTRAVGAVVTAPEGTVNAPLYDTADQTVWLPGTGTGANGASLIFGIPVGTVTVFATDANATAQLTIDSIPIAEGFLSWITDSF